MAIPADGRLRWVDVGRGLGIVLMTLGHVAAAPGGGWLLPALEPFVRWIYLFHMPVFFVLSGVVFHKGLVTGKFVARRLRTLLVPYAIWSLYFVAKPLALALFGTRPWPAWQEMVAIVGGIVIFGQGLWFLMALFVGELGAHVLIDRVRLEGAVLAAAGLALVCGSYVLARLGLEEALPLQLVQGMRAAGLICIGTRLRDRWPNGETPQSRAGILLATVIVFVVSGQLALIDADLRLLPTFAAVAAAVSGSLVVVALSRAVAASPLLERIGRDSLACYVTAPLFTNFARLGYLAIVRDAQIAPGAPTQALAAALMCAATLVPSLAIAPLVRRHAPWALGMRGPQDKGAALS